MQSSCKIFSRKQVLKPVEYNELIVFWYPQIKDYPYVQIAFAGQEYEDSAKLIIIPKPDSILRVFVYFKKLYKKTEIEPQTIHEIRREGFSVVEWGGGWQDPHPSTQTPVF